MADRGLTGVLLLGGASRRFGTPKALARFAGETLAERAWAVLGEACDERIAAGKAADELPLPFPVLDDGTEVRHPAAGVVAALRAARHEVCVVLPVDCPLVRAASLRALGEACLETGVEAAVVDGAMPFPAAVRRSTLPVFEECLAAEGPIRAALRRVGARAVAIDPDELVDADTPEALDAIRPRGGG